MNQSLTPNSLIMSLNAIDSGTIQAQGGRPIMLEEPFRKQLVQELERCLIDQDRFDFYMAALLAALESRPRYADLLEREGLSKVLQNGLSVLDDTALVRLALNPTALKQLYDQLLSSDSESIGDHLAYLMCEAELRARGLPPWSEWQKAIKSGADLPHAIIPNSRSHSRGEKQG